LVFESGQYCVGDQGDEHNNGTGKQNHNTTPSFNGENSDNGGEEIEVVEGEYALANPSYLGKKTQEIYLGQYSQAVKQSLGLGKAKGGRINYATGEMVEQVVEKVAEPEEDSLSYEELRSRLPEEITDDIVVILSESPSALVDFSEIQTQIDVDEFNMKYGVNLSLPSGA